MDWQILYSNFTNPTLLFFVLGVFAVLVKSDLEIPPQSVKFISVYLLFSIGFNGGQELAHHSLSSNVIICIFAGIVLSIVIPFYVFHLLKKKVGKANAGAIAAAYGSVSAVTFVAATNFAATKGIQFGGYMVAVMAIMEAPAIIAGVLLMKAEKKSLGPVISHSLTNSSVIVVLGSLIIGLVSDSKQALGIKPFTTDIFKGFLAIFLLEMGMVTARRIKGCLEYGKSILFYAILFPLVNGCVIAYASGYFIEGVGDRFIFSVLAASASYIAVPASMRLAAPEADPGLYIPMALGITFPFNITVGMPLYLMIILSGL